MSFRPKTLTAAIIPVIVATAVCYRQSEALVWWISIFAVLGAVMIQIGTNLFNDALDFKKGADTETRLGPKRVTASGLVSEKKVMLMACASFALAVLFGVPLVIHGGWVIVAIGVVSLFCGYAYTGGPFPLAYKGLGDLFVIIFFGLVSVGGVVFLHLGTLTTASIVAGLQIGFLGTVLIAINNLRDVEGDSLVDKKTLAVRFGKSFVRFEILFLFLATYALNLFWFKEDVFWASLLPLLTLPIALKLIISIFNTEPSEVYNKYLAQSAVLHILFGLLLTLGLFSS